MDPITIGVTAAATGAIASTVLNRVVPSAYETFKEKVRGFFLKTVTVTLSQNKMKFVNLIRFLTEFPQFRHSNCSMISIDNQEYEVPTGKVAVPFEGHKFVFFIGM